MEEGQNPSQAQEAKNVSNNTNVNSEKEFSLAYIKELRQEAADYRIKAKSLEEELLKIKPLSEKATNLESELNQIKTQRRLELLEKLPEDKRENFKEFELNHLEIIVKNFSETPQTQSPGTLPKQDQTITKSFEDMTEEDLLDLMINNRSAYDKMLREKISKQLGN